MLKGNQVVWPLSLWFHEKEESKAEAKDDAESEVAVLERCFERDLLK
jgi:hypothetical protein